MTYNTQSWPVLATMQALIAMLPGTNKDWIPSDVFQSHRANLTRDTMSSLSKIIAGVLLAAGLVLAFVAWRLASAPSSPPQPVTPVAASAPAPQEPVKFYPVVVAAKAIPAGTRIAPDMLEVAKWQVACRAAFRRPTCSPARSCAPTSPWAIPLAVHAGAWHGQPAAAGRTRAGGGGG